MLISDLNSPRENSNQEIGLFRKEYRRRKPLYERALGEIKKLIGNIKLKNQGDASLRIAYIDGRIKNASSLISKACNKDIPIENVFDEMEDILGVRVIVNNLKDISPFIDELKVHSKLKIYRQEEHGKDGPYRAIHIKASFLVANCGSEEVVFELQIRSLLQDVWAILTHHDIYKNQGSLPPLANVISEHLSNALNALDRLANSFRNEIEKEVVPLNDLSDAAPLDKQGVAFLFYELFGKTPQEYEVDYLIKRANEFGLKTIGEARKGLDFKILERLKRIHDTRFAGIPVDRDLLEFGMLYVNQGRSAFKEYRARIEAEWEEIEDYGRSEALSELPDTFDELVDTIRDGYIPWDALKVLGAVSNCFRCGTEVLNENKAAEVIMEHYRFPETKEDVELLIFEAANMEGIDLEFSGACGTCDHQMSKDD